MWITEFTNYKDFLRATMANFPNRGRGQAKRLAEELRVTPAVISQVLTRDRDLTIDQALTVANHFGFDLATTDYFLSLVILARAETPALRAYEKLKLEKLRDESERIKNLVVGKEELSDADKARFYSNWYYSGVRILSSIEGYQSVDKIAEYFGLSKSKVAEIVAFLVNCGLCEIVDGKIRVGKKSTHVSDDSHFVDNHRKNWREKAREKLTEPDPKDLFYTSPVSMSQKEAEEFRKKLLNLIKDFSSLVAKSPEEKTMCINIDWFSF